MIVTFVSSTDTGIGKTHVIRTMISKLHEIGVKVFALKPLESGFNLESSDCNAILSAKNVYNDNPLKLEDINYKTYNRICSIYGAQPNFNLNEFRGYMKHKLETLRDYDVVLVEGAGGLFSPITLEYFMLDIAREFCDQVLLISHSSLGCINHIVLNHKILKCAKLKFLIYVNVRDDNFYKDSLPFLSRYSSHISSLFSDALKFVQH